MEDDCNRRRRRRHYARVGVAHFGSAPHVIADRVLRAACADFHHLSRKINPVNPKVPAIHGGDRG